MTKIKIFVDAHVFDGFYQGTTTYLNGLYNSLVNDDAFEITLGAHNIENLKISFNDPRFKFAVLPSKSKLKRLTIDIPRIIKINQFNFAHFQYITPIQKSFSCHYINTIHDLLFLDFPCYFPFLYKFIRQPLFNKSALNSKIICTVSEYSKQALIRHFNVNEEKIIVTPNAVNIDSHELRINIKEKYSLKKFILFVSRFEPRKNHYGLLKSFIDLRLFERDYHLVLIGKSNEVKTHDFNELYSKLSETEKKSVLHLENVSANEIAEFYRHADLFVYPSFAEGFGIPPLEAALANCKVLCSNQTAMEDFTFFNPYLFNPHDIDDFKSKLLKILDDKSYPYEAVRKLIIQKYNWIKTSSTFGIGLKAAL